MQSADGFGRRRRDFCLRLFIEQSRINVRKAFNFLPLNRHAGEALDATRVAHVFFSDERERITTGLRAARAADAVHVIFGVFWDIVVDHMRDARDVQTTRSDVGRDENFEFA